MCKETPSQRITRQFREDEAKHIAAIEAAITIEPCEICGDPAGAYECACANNVTPEGED